MRLSTMVFSVALVASAASHAQQSYFGSVSQAGASPPGCVLQQYSSFSAPGGVTQTCSDSTGVGGGSAAAASGHVAGSANSTVIAPGGYWSSIVNAGWSDSSVLITNTANPGFIGAVNGSLNFVFAGNLGGLGADLSLSVVEFDVIVNGMDFAAQVEHSTQGDSCIDVNLSFCALYGGTSMNAALATQTISLPVGTPFSLEFDLLIITEGLGLDASASADFTRSLDLAFGGALFNFANPGYTVNAGNYIVNNRYVPAGGGNTVPEPATWLLLAAGLCAMGMARREGMRKRAATRA
ncbi:MAG TPA: PEP-CTERM sorting domain-containing protein [Casimicrobiaceae bacterium]|nr:PEP-CTERM sorting domain-containing protein [Casimicrobiaceae bacterium]